MNRSPHAIPLFAAAGAAMAMACPRVVHGGEQHIVCPPNLEPAAVQGKPPPGWRFAMSQAARLTEAGMLHGAPDEGGYLAPADISRQGSGSGWVQRWRFERPHWYPTFVYCGYGGGSGTGPLPLSYPVREDVRECTLTSSKKGDVLVRADFVCR